MTQEEMEEYYRQQQNAWNNPWEKQNYGLSPLWGAPPLSNAMNDILKQYSQAMAQQAMKPLVGYNLMKKGEDPKDPPKNDLAQRVEVAVHPCPLRDTQLVEITFEIDGLELHISKDEIKKLLADTLKDAMEKALPLLGGQFAMARFKASLEPKEEE
jgi:hypothetical protein